MGNNPDSVVFYGIVCTQAWDEDAGEEIVPWVGMGLPTEAGYDEDDVIALVMGWRPYVSSPETFNSDAWEHNRDHRNRLLELCPVEFLRTGSVYDCDPPVWCLAIKNTVQRAPEWGVERIWLSLFGGVEGPAANEINEWADKLGIPPERRAGEPGWHHFADGGEG